MSKFNADEPCDEAVDVVCSSGHSFLCQPSRRVPEEERITFCPTCFVAVVAPLCKDQSKWVNW